MEQCSRRWTIGEMLMGERARHAKQIKFYNGDDISRQSR